MEPPTGFQGTQVTTKAPSGEVGRWFTWHGLRKGCELLGECYKSRGEEMEWGAEAQRGCVPYLKSLSPLGSYIDDGGQERINGSWSVT